MKSSGLRAILGYFMMCAFSQSWGSPFWASEYAGAARSSMRENAHLYYPDIQDEDAQAFMTRVVEVFDWEKTTIFIDEPLFDPFLSKYNHKSLYDLFYKAIGDALGAHPNVTHLHIGVLLDRDHLSCLLVDLLQKNNLQHLALCADQALSSDILKDALTQCQSLKSVALVEAREDFSILPLLLSAPHVNTLRIGGNAFTCMHFTCFLKETLRARPVQTLFLSNMLIDLKTIQPFFSFLKDETSLTTLLMMSIYLRGVPLDVMGGILEESKTLTHVRLAGIYQSVVVGDGVLYDSNVSAAASKYWKPPMDPPRDQNTGIFQTPWPTEEISEV